MTLCIYIDVNGGPLQMNLDIDNNEHGEMLQSINNRVSLAGMVGEDIVVCKAMESKSDKINSVRFKDTIEESIGPLILIRMDQDSCPQSLPISEFINLIE